MWSEIHLLWLYFLLCMVEDRIALYEIISVRMFQFYVKIIYFDPQTLIQDSSITHYSFYRSFSIPETKI